MYNSLPESLTQCVQKNVRFFNVLEFGKEGRKIVSFAQKNNFDLIVIGSRRMGKNERDLFWKHFKLCGS